MESTNPNLVGQDLARLNADAQAAHDRAVAARARAEYADELASQRTTDRNWAIFSTGMVSGILLTLILLAVELAVR